MDFDIRQAWVTRMFVWTTRLFLQGIKPQRSFLAIFQPLVDQAPTENHILLPTGSEEREVLGDGEYSCCNTSLLSRYENYCIIIP